MAFDGRQMLKRLAVLLGTYLGSGGCSMQPNPGVALQDVRFSERPHIVMRGGNYYLRYRIATEHGGMKPLRMLLCARKGQGKGYYFFSVPVSHVEPGDVVERPLADDDFTELARRNAVYWLNPDGSEVPLDAKTPTGWTHD